MVKAHNQLRQALSLFASRLSLRLLDSNERRFVRHNSQVWKYPRVSGNGEVLFEIGGAASAIIAYSYLADVLQRKFNAKIVAYSLAGHSSQSHIMRLTKKLLDNCFPGREKKIFSSFGADTFVAVEPSQVQRDRGVRIIHELYPSLHNKRDVENLTVDGIWIGDLIYDTYLRERAQPTIDLQDERFLSFLQESLAIFVFWQDYFEQHEVRAVNVSHCVYNNAMPLRIAVSRNIPVYQTNATHVYRMNKGNLFAYGDYRYFPEKFSLLSSQEQQAGKREAQKRIELRFSGQVGVDMRYSTKSAYGKKRSARVLRSSDKFKVLIAAHCFFDSPHSYGNNLFPDFYEWFDFIGKVSNETAYDWYVKTHPDFLPGNMEVINYFLGKYPRLTLIDAATSHHQLIEEGVGCALTSYGTIGFEYAALGILVVNASLCNPHIAYDFNLHPESIAKYSEILHHLDRQSLQINKEQVYEYYFMKNIFNTENWLFADYQDMIARLGGYRAQFSSSAYDYFLNGFNEFRHAQVLDTLSRFVDSDDFRLGREHMGEA
jgi:hypothetical protein